MSGTSLDAVDAAAILTDGTKILEFGPVAERSYTAQERHILAEAVRAARDWNWIGDPPEAEFQKARNVLTGTHIDAFAEIVSKSASEKRPEFVGVHGQTVLHRAPVGEQKGATLQVVDAQAMASAFGIPVYYDFRSADVEASGQGAPLAPVYHQALSFAQPKPIAVLNLGGVANLTYIADGDEILGFDCGPANGPVDEWVEGHDKGRFDQDGAGAAAGHVHEHLLTQWLNHPFFGEALPKSLDRYDFNASLARGLSYEDGCATLTAFSAASVALGLTLFPQKVRKVIVCGGGRRNPVLMQELKNRCGCQVVSAEEEGWRGDSIEAEAFAFLAARSRHGLPISFPGTTGVVAPLTGGRVALPKRDQ